MCGSYRFVSARFEEEAMAGVQFARWRLVTSFAGR